MSQTAMEIETSTVLTDEVRAAAKAFAGILAETPEFQAFEEAAVAYRQDRAAQQAVRLFEEKQRSLVMMQQLNMLTQEELAELKRLLQAMMNEPSVCAYVESQNTLMLLCQAAAQELSQVIGLDFVRACAPGCC